METGDPDDFLTRPLPGGHPGIDLRAVIVTPGSGDQIAVVHWALGPSDVPSGAFTHSIEQSSAERTGTLNPPASPRGTHACPS